MNVYKESEELERIYVAIGDGLEITDEISDRIRQLEAIVNPTWWTECLPSDRPEGCGCSNPSGCWDCAAIRGGCPEDV